MALDITAYTASYDPPCIGAEAPYDARGQEVASLRCSYGSGASVKELFRALKWRDTCIDGHGRWISRDQIQQGLQQFRIRQERELQKPRNRRKDLTAFIRFLENCLESLHDECAYIVIVAV